MKKRTILGAFALACVFVAGASLAWAYLADASQAKEEAQAAAVALAQQEPQEPQWIEPASTLDAVFADLHLQAKSAFAVDETTGHILYESDPDVQWPLASLTKVALVLSVVEVLPPETVVTIPYDTAPAGSYERLAKGDRWPLSQVIDFTIAASSNQGADILADAAASAISAAYPQASTTPNPAVWRMNDLAKSLGMTRTYFLNDNGLDESTTQSGAYGSARDVAALFAYAASTTPQTFSATKESSFTLTSPYGATASVINTDDALPAIPNIVMGKTGYTDLAGGNLAVVFDENGHRLIAVVLGSTEGGRFSDMEALVARIPKALIAESAVQ